MIRAFHERVSQGSRRAAFGGPQASGRRRQTSMPHLIAPLPPIFSRASSIRAEIIPVSRQSCQSLTAHSAVALSAVSPCRVRFLDIQLYVGVCVPFQLHAPIDSFAAVFWRPWARACRGSRVAYRLTSTYYYNITSVLAGGHRSPRPRGAHRGVCVWTVLSQSGRRVCDVMTDL